MIAIDLQALDADPKPIKQINFTGIVVRAGNTAMFFVIEKAKKIVLDFWHGNVRVL